MKNLLLFSVLFIVVVIASCKKENTLNPSSTVYERYFPVDSGFERIYQVDSIYWDGFSGTNDSVKYQIKEIVAGTFMDLQGRETQRIERYRQDSTGNWIIWKVWSANLLNTGAERSEENTRFLKLIFPSAVGATWNGNTYNTNDRWDYEYTAINEPASVGNLNFDSTLTVLQYDDFGENIIERIRFEERYAVGAGLYYKENINQNLTSGIIVDGYIYRETLISYSHLP